MHLWGLSETEYQFQPVLTSRPGLVSRLHGANAVFMPFRRTLKRVADCQAVGLHSGQTTRLVLRPAPAEHGIRFRRTDLHAEIPATLDCLTGVDHATRLSCRGASVETVEHLLSALRGVGVDDAIVEVDGPEI